jgi:hypothetical protein
VRFEADASKSAPGLRDTPASHTNRSADHFGPDLRTFSH